MDEPDALYCEVYVNAPTDEKGLTKTVTNIVNGETRRWSIASDLLNIRVERNEGIMATPGDNLTSFVNYPYYLAVDPPETGGVERTRYVDAVGRLLEGLWALGYDAVAACNFEDELPRFGGYRSKERRKERDGSQPSSGHQG